MKRITPRQSLALLAGVGLATSLLSRRMAPFGPGGPISRRSLMTFGGLGLAALGTVAWKGRSAALRSSAGSAAPRLVGGSSARAVSCVLTPEQTEGPYYIPKEKVRRTITEHRPGTPLTLGLSVVDAATCQPIAGAVVDIWHCDAGGVYSGFESASAGGPGGPGGGPPPGGTPPADNGGPPPGGTPPAGTGGFGSPGGAGSPTDTHTFLRGIQRTDARGICAFDTIYPGWYRGRTVHIHVKAHVGGTVVHTGQLYFADSLTDAVYQTGVYKARAAARHAQQRRLHLRERRPAVDAHDEARRRRVFRHDHAWRAALLMGRR